MKATGVIAMYNRPVTRTMPPLGLSAAPLLKKYLPGFTNAFLVPVAKAYNSFSGWRKYGLMYDDLIIEENPEVQKAIGRLTPEQLYARNFRLKRAHHQMSMHRTLPKDQWVKPEEDIRYLTPHIKRVEADYQERIAWDNITIDTFTKAPSPGYVAPGAKHH